GERVEGHHFVRSELEQVPDEVRRDEPRSACHQYSFHSSSSIVYSGLPSTSRWTRPSDSPISASTNPWMPRTRTMPAPAKSGPGKLLCVIQYATPYTPSAAAATVHSRPSVTPIHCTGCAQK